MLPVELDHLQEVCELDDPQTQLVLQVLDL